MKKPVNQGFWLQESLQIEIHFRGDEAVPTGNSQIHHLLTVTVKEIKTVMVPDLMDKHSQNSKHVLHIC